MTPGLRYIGNTERLTVNVYDASDADTDVLTLTCTVMDPAGTATTDRKSVV